MYLEVFAQCYQTRIDGMTGQIVMERTALPEAGGVMDQDAQTMDAFELLAQVTCAIWCEQQQQMTRDRRRQEKRKKRRG